MNKTRVLLQTTNQSIYQMALQDGARQDAPHHDSYRLKKLERIRRGGSPRMLDLFSGCGGLSLGFHSAGFSIAGAVELDDIAARSHAVNFHKTRDGTPDQAHAQPRDIRTTEPGTLINELFPGEDIASTIDVLVGGPPCQAFARVGRAKLREVAEHPEAFKLDERGNLYLRYLAYVRQLRPVAILMENVPDVINYGGHNISHEICEVLTDSGYRCAYTLLNAAYYGVPQMRERMFLLAYAHELETEVEFPTPTHWVELPRGYEGSRRVALKMLDSTLFSPDRAEYFLAPPVATKDLTPAVKARDALADLPEITIHLEGKLKRGARHFNQLAPYRSDIVPSAFALEMRNWTGFGNQQGVYDHVIRWLPRDYALFRRMNPGDQYPEAYDHAVAMFHERLSELKRAGKEVPPESPEFKRLWSEIVPPYDAGKFPNKWRKMEADKPARTLMAHLGKDGYSHIHYDSEQARTISVREAARLQSFPDGFRFCGTMNPAFRQIGNAVPPLMARALAKAILSKLAGV